MLSSKYDKLFSFAFLLTGIWILFTSLTLVNKGLKDDVLQQTNKFRKTKGLPALIMRQDLNEIARKHSENMAKGKCGFGHSGFEQRAKQVKKTLRPNCTIAENVAYGSTGTGADEAVKLWINSSAHRANLLGDFRYVGIGTARSETGTIYYTQLFVR